MEFEIIMMYYLANEFFLNAHQNMHTHFFLYFLVSVITYRLQHLLGKKHLKFISKRIFVKLISTKLSITHNGVV